MTQDILFCYASVSHRCPRWRAIDFCLHSSRMCSWWLCLIFGRAALHSQTAFWPCPRFKGPKIVTKGFGTVRSSSRETLQTIFKQCRKHGTNKSCTTPTWSTITLWYSFKRRCMQLCPSPNTQTQTWFPKQEVHGCTVYGLSSAWPSAINFRSHDYTAFQFAVLALGQFGGLVEQLSVNCR